MKVHIFYYLFITRHFALIAFNLVSALIVYAVVSGLFTAFNVQPILWVMVLTFNFSVLLVETGLFPELKLIYPLTRREDE